MNPHRTPSFNSLQQWILYQQFLSSQGFANPLLNANPNLLMRTGGPGVGPSLPNTGANGHNASANPAGILSIPMLPDVSPSDRQQCN